MEYTLLLNKNDDLKKVEAEEQTRFVKTVLDELKVPFEWKTDGLLTADEKIKLRKVLETYNIDVIDTPGGNVKVYVSRDLIGEWKKCEFRLCKDHSQLDPKNRLYIEMHCNFSTIFENHEPT